MDLTYIDVQSVIDNNRELEAKLKHLESEYKILTEGMEIKAEKYEKALKFYADNERWAVADDSEGEVAFLFHTDYGDGHGWSRAREALKE